MRQKSRFKAKLVSGEEVGVMLPRGEILRGGDLVTTSDGRIIEVIAQPENVLHVEVQVACRAGENRVSPRQPPCAR